MPTTSLDDLSFEDNDKKISSHTEPTGTSEEVVPNNFWDTGDVSGEVTTRDKKWPRLNLGQKAGNIGEDKGFGSLVLNREIVILPGFPSNQNQGPILPGVVVIKIQKGYQEKREYDPSATSLPRLFKTAKEANDAGFSTEWGVGERQVQPVAAMLLLVPAPTVFSNGDGGIENFFPYEFNGTHYLAAGFFATGTSWHEAAKPVFTAIDTPKVKSYGEVYLRATRWNMSVIRRSGVKGAWYALKLSTGGYNSNDLIQYTKDILP